MDRRHSRINYCQQWSNIAVLDPTPSGGGNAPLFLRREEELLPAARNQQ